MRLHTALKKEQTPIQAVAKQAIETYSRKKSMKQYGEEIALVIKTDEN